MAKKAETTFKDRIVPVLTRLPNSYWIKIQQIALCGHPDLIGCINGQMIAIELKKDDKQGPEPLQEWHLQKVAKAGGMAFVVTPENWAETYELLSNLACSNLDSNSLIQ